MMAITHAAIAAAGTSLILGTASPFNLGLAILGSQLPDLDTSTSLIGQILFPISHWIEDRYPHRTITHSLLATGFITICSILVGYYWLGQIWAFIALPLGHLLSCFSDCFTRQGVQLFYPYPAWAISVSNPRRRLKTGSAAELWVLAVATALLIVGVNLANDGGITQKVSQQLGLKEGLIEVYNKNAANHHVYAEIKGVKVGDRSPIEGKFLILGTEGSEFIVTDGEGVYKTNEQIIISKLNTTVGETATTNIQTLTFDDEDAVEPLQQLNNSYPNAAIYLTGNLTIDFPEEVKIKIEPEEYTVIELTGNSLKFSWCPIEEALSYLNDQYAIGTLTAKIITPKAEGK
jgi:inner membrane protein